MGRGLARDRFYFDPGRCSDLAMSSGPLTIEHLETLFRDREIDTVIVAFTDLYGRLMGKRFDAGFFLEEVARHGTHGCDYLFTVDMEMEPVQGYAFANWELGYGDVHLVPDLATLHRAAWLDRTAIVLCDVVGNATHAPVPIAPRSLLKRQIEGADGIGVRVLAASELEYYLFETSYRDAAKQDFRELEPAGWYLEDYHIFQGTRQEKLGAEVRRGLRDSGLPVESTKGEWGLGQHELNVRYAEALVMADRHNLYKQCLRETAERLGLSVTFMAKLGEKHAGSSCHVHLSLRRDGKSAFAGDNDFCGVQCSDEFRWFLGGWIAHVGDVMPFYAPTVNSYKRYRAGSWAPTRIAWSRDNRTAGFRVVGAGESLRIECRIPGADCNPYLTYAAALASGLDGIANRIEPPLAFEGDVYAAESLPRVAASLRDATDGFERSAFARATFGDDVVDHYTRFFRVEQEAFDTAVTDWERRRYFERI